jgi:hypothetical protein
MTRRQSSFQTSARGPGGDFPERVRKALAPLMNNATLLESTALKIERLTPCEWTFPKHSTFFEFEGKIGRVVGHFAPDGLTPGDYLQTAMRRPGLFVMNPEKMIANIEAVAKHFEKHGLTRGDYLACAIKQPQLFWQRPRTLISNIERVVKHFKNDGLSHEEYLRAAMQQPRLFFSKPRTIICRIDLITNLYRKGFLSFREQPVQPRADAAPVLEYMLRNPQLFGMSKENIALRETYARATNARSAAKLLRTSRRRIEQELADALSPHRSQYAVTTA